MDRFKAVEDGDVKKIRECLQQGRYSVNQRYNGETLLHYACMSGQLDIVKVLLSEFKAKLSVKDSTGNTPFLTACKWGHLDIVKVLVSEYKADLSMQNVDGCTALMLAARRGHEDVVIALLRDYQCSVNDTDKKGWGALHHACTRWSESMIQTLIRDYKANVNLQDKNSNTPLHVAINKYNFYIALCLIREFGCDPNMADKQGQTPLHYACEKGRLELVKALLDNKADTSICDHSKQTPLKVAFLNQHHNVAMSLILEYGCNPNVTDQQGRTPLHYACEKGELGKVKALLDNKADATICNHSKQTPLEVAFLHQHYKVVISLILEYGCDPNVTDQQGRTPLHYACEKGELEKVKALICDHKADATTCNNSKQTPLEVAFLHQHYDVVFRLILECGCDPNVTDQQGQTPLHYACENGELEKVKALIRDHKADATTCNNSKQTPLEVAFLHQHYDVAFCLIREFGCNPNVTDQQGQTPLHYACENGELEKVKALIRDHKADATTCNNLKQTPLEVAFLHQHYDVVFRLILECGCDPNVTDQHGRTPLHYACKTNYSDVVLALAHNHKADLNAYNKQMKTPLHVAVEEGKCKAVLALVGCDSNLADRLGETPLHYACRRGDIDLVHALLRDHKADVTTSNNSKKTPLEVAVCHQHLDIALCFICEFGCDPNVADQKGQTPLHFACKRGDLEQVKALISNHKTDLNACDKTMKTPLHVAVLEGKCEVVLAMVGCDPNMADRHGQTPLYYACQRGDIDLIRALVYEHKADFNTHNLHQKKTLLEVTLNHEKLDVAFSLILEFGCNPNVVDEQGLTPLHYACRKGDIDLILALTRDHKADVHTPSLKTTPLQETLNYCKFDASFYLIHELHCDPNAVDQKGQTLLHHTHKVNVVNALVHDHKANVNARDKQMKTPLHMAAEKGKYEVAKALIGCDSNLADQQGQTPLHHACKLGHADFIHSLLNDHKADATVSDKQGDTPLHVAANAGHYEVVVSLVSEYGCDFCAQGHMARTPLHMASLAGHHRIIQSLLKLISPQVTDEQGNTPLHLASAWDHVLAVKCLLQANAPVLIRNKNGHTTLDVAKGESKLLLGELIKENCQQIPADHRKMTEQARKRFSGSHYITRLFVIGNPGAGKSSFIESLKREGFFQSLWSVSESSVPPHTAGIIPSVHMSKQYGRVMFYDFAGDPEYYSSHAAIFESLASSKKGINIFIIVVDMQDITIETTLHYWFTFIDYQKFREASLIVVGSHLDQSAKQNASLDQFCTSMQPNVQNIKYFMMDCRDPRSNQIAQFKKQVYTCVCESQKYELSCEARLLLGLLEKDFSAVTACPVQTLVSHIKQAGVWLPVEPKPLCNVLLELHEVGVVLLLGDCTKDTDHVILNTAKLTNEVHEQLFSESPLSNIKETKTVLNAAYFNIGILPQDVLNELLPPYITTECLVHLQYCQKISHDDVRFFPCLEHDDSTSQSFLFFPALCSVDKSQVPWDESTDASSFTIGWLALCTRPHDYFPPRFLHVLLLRLVYGFTLSPARLKTAPSPEHSRRCTMWKKGVHWKMEEGVECMVELVNGSKGVVVLSKSSMDGAEECGRVFTKVVSCVMEAKAEFCHSTKPEFFLLNSSAEADFLNENHLFAVSDVERALESPEGKRVILSVSGRGEMELSKLQCIRKLTHWDNLFPIDLDTALHVLTKIVKTLHELVQNLGVPHHILQAIEDNCPYDVDKRRRELVRWWMSSSQDPPCWYHLVQALRRIDEKVLAEAIQQEHGLHIQLQEKILCEETQALKPDKEFLHSLSGVVGSGWPSLAVSLALSEAEIEGIKGKVRLTEQQFTHQDLALQMLNIWVSRKKATYGQLCEKLKIIHLFQCLS